MRAQWLTCVSVFYHAFRDRARPSDLGYIASSPGSITHTDPLSLWCMFLPKFTIYTPGLSLRHCMTPRSSMLHMSDTVIIIAHSTLIRSITLTENVDLIGHTRVTFTFTFTCNRTTRLRRPQPQTSKKEKLAHKVSKVTSCTRPDSKNITILRWDTRHFHDVQTLITQVELAGLCYMRISWINYNI